MPGSEKATPSADAGPSAAAQELNGEEYPDIVDATLRPRSDTVFDVEVTVSSPYDTPQRYADGWRVLTQDGTELGSHTLLHDHAGEQPFTRVQAGLAIPEGVSTVVIEGRDLVNGYGGATLEVAVPGR